MASSSSQGMAPSDPATSICEKCGFEGDGIENLKASKCPFRQFETTVSAGGDTAVEQITKGVTKLTLEKLTLKDVVTFEALEEKLESKMKKGHCTYVSQTDNMKRRWKEHAHVKSGVMYYAAEKERFQKMTEVEQKLIDRQDTTKKQSCFDFNKEAGKDVGIIAGVYLIVCDKDSIEHCSAVTEPAKYKCGCQKINCSDNRCTCRKNDQPCRRGECKCDPKKCQNQEKYKIDKFQVNN